ncbi:MAG: TetR/AcrR family transcriptional regulator [Bacteroidales bacterium]|nr:TetR/AcrR family transcriptional regulator [Bacteroidales bacterium]MDD4669776.1 TetR/AcrR family transcriptional regulator [Bacteroidales bacterium]
MIKETEESSMNMEGKILEAAEKLFLEKGFAMTSTTEIAKEAGCNQALIHYYFRTKEKLFQKIFESKIDLFATTIFNNNSKAGTFDDKIRNVVYTHFDIIAKNPKLPFLIVNELSTNPKQVEWIKDKFHSLMPIRQFEDALNAEIDAGAIRHATVFEIAFNIATLNFGFFIALPIFTGVMGITDKECISQLIEARKEEIANVVISSLRP